MLVALERYIPYVHNMPTDCFERYSETRLIGTSPLQHFLLKI